MAKQISITGIATGQTIEASQVSQSVQAFTGAEAYDIEISGSLSLTGSFIQQTGSAANLARIQLKQVALNTGSALPASFGFVAIDSAGLLYSASAAAGSQGTTGTTGPNGVQGTVGTLGTQGNTGGGGAQGAIGSGGSNGSQGTAGSAGAQGGSGAQGESGPAGPQGTEGTDGSNGAQGTNGTVGSTGGQGTTGTVGTQGETGNTGSGGAQGNTGSTGPAGGQGTTGAGTQGTIGAQGTEGTDATGTQGTTGTTGPTGTGTQGTIGGQGTTGTGAQGTDGTTGPTGPTGPLGPQGTEGTDATGTQGTVGTTGPTGPNGPDGPDGPNGPNGPDGSQGTVGTVGTQGTIGTGTTGPQGTVGTDGPNGPQGTEGSGGGSATVFNPNVRYNVFDSTNCKVDLMSTGDYMGGVTWARVGAEATLTFTNHGLTSGDVVSIRNMGDTNYNSCAITLVDANSFKVQGMTNSGTTSGTEAAYIPCFSASVTLNGTDSITGLAITAPGGLSGSAQLQTLNIFANQQGDPIAITFPIGTDEGSGFGSAAFENINPMAFVAQKDAGAGASTTSITPGVSYGRASGQNIATVTGVGEFAPMVIKGYTL